MMRQTDAQAPDISIKLLAYDGEMLRHADGKNGIGKGTSSPPPHTLQELTA